MLNENTTILPGTGMSKIRKLTFSSITIALYIVIMYFTQSFAFGQYQVRIATSLYALSGIFPFLIIPLGIANLLSNTLMGGLGLFDIIGGFLVGILTAGSCYFLRKINIVLVALPIIFIPALVVPIWLSYLIHVPYLLLALSIGVGQILPGLVGVLIVKRLEKPLLRMGTGKQYD